MVCVVVGLVSASCRYQVPCSGGLRVRDGTQDEDAALVADDEEDTLPPGAADDDDDEEIEI